VHGFLLEDLMADRTERDAADVARKVGASYERHPYLSAVDDLDVYRESRDDRRWRADVHLFDTSSSTGSRS
jgi:hypothetical protein